jgi:drug/metabolite transporter (DMT)-like permease
VFLCKTYELGDMSLTYPIIRSAPIFVVVAALIFLREIPTIPALFGIIIVMLGVYIINQKSLVFSDFFRSFGHVNKKAMLAAMLTAFTSACYSVIDKKGVLEIDPVLFFYLFFAISGFLFLIYLLCMKERRRLYFDVLKKHKLGITLAAVLEFASYVLILYAFRISKVSYIIALRQISVIFGALYGILFLKEKYGKIRLAGAAIIFIGIFLITVFGK